MARCGNPCDLTTSIVVACPIQKCWDLYVRNSLMAQWSPAVSQVECDTELLNINVIRKSHASIDGKAGHSVEQCTLFEPLKRIEFSVIEETFGFSHMLNSYGFGVSFDAEAENTFLLMHTRYVPKRIFSSLMNAESTQQKLTLLMSESLNGFKQYAESSS